MQYIFFRKNEVETEEDVVQFGQHYSYEFYDVEKGKYHLRVDDIWLNSEELVGYWSEWINTYPIVSIEDIIAYRIAKEKLIEKVASAKLPTKYGDFKVYAFKSSVDKLLKTLSQRYEKRKGGYSRVIRSGFRYGDDAPMAVIELVDRDPNARRVDIPKKAAEKKDKDKQTPPKVITK